MQLDAAFEKWWPDLEEQLQEAAEWEVPAAEPSREDAGSSDKRFDQVIQSIKTLQLQVEELTTMFRQQPGFNPKRDALLRMANESRFDEEPGLSLFGLSSMDQERVGEILAAAGHNASSVKVDRNGVEIWTDRLPAMATRLEVTDYLGSRNLSTGKVNFFLYDAKSS